jgi:hypothetical protein
VQKREKTEKETKKTQLSSHGKKKDSQKKCIALYWFFWFSSMRANIDVTECTRSFKRYFARADLHHIFRPSGIINQYGILTRKSSNIYQCEKIQSLLVKVRLDSYPTTIFAYTSGISDIHQRVLLAKSEKIKHSSAIECWKTLGLDNFTVYKKAEKFFFGIGPRYLSSVAICYNVYR